MLLNKTQRAISLRVKDFVFLPDTFHFGADQYLTVITAYLTLSPRLTEAVKQRRTKLQTGEPVALIVAYDTETAKLLLYCIDTQDTQCAIELRPTERRALYISMCEATQQIYGYTPKDMLNYIRNSANLPSIM